MVRSRNSREPGSLDRYGDVNNLAIGIGTSKLAQGNCGHTAVGDVEKYKGEAPEIDVFRPPAPTPRAAPDQSGRTVRNRSEINVSIYSTFTGRRQLRACSNRLVDRPGRRAGGNLCRLALFGATGGNAANIARQIAAAVGLEGAWRRAVGRSHGPCRRARCSLSAVVQVLSGRLARDAAISSFVIGSLAAVWVINYFVVLPVVSPGFVHLLPYAVTLASKLAFGVIAAITSQQLRPKRGRRIPLIVLRSAVAAPA